MGEDNNIIAGKVYVLGDNIDTDLIIPAEYLNLVPTIAEEYRKLGSYALAGLPASYEPFVKKGSSATNYPIVVAGKNFGCGSSREHAPIALGAAGVRAVIAESYARIFFRNAVATGELYPVEATERICDMVRTGDEISVDLKTNTITIVGRGRTVRIKPIGAVAPVVEAGGLFAYARKTGMIKKAKKTAAKKVVAKKVVAKKAVAKKAVAKKASKCGCCCK